MASSQNNAPNDRPAPKNIRDRTDGCEDEIDIIDYFRVLWKRKYFIAIGSALPALLAGLVLFFSPSDYKVTYTYNTQLKEEGRAVLLDQFYGAGNLGKLGGKLRENGFGGYAEQISRANIQLEISDASLTMTVLGRPANDIQKISLIVRDNLEKVMPVYSVKKELDVAIARLKSDMADIEEGKFTLGRELEKKRAILIKLKNLEPAGSDKVSSGIVLQFDCVGQNSEYLPLAYQIQATESKIINLEETVEENQERHNYYERLVNLNKRLAGEIESRASSHYTVHQYHSWLTDIASDYEDKELANYLSAYIKRIENVISRNAPVVESPSVNTVPKGSAKKRSASVFVALLIIATFAAFLLEAVQKRQNQVS
ncbi:MAG: hypothetical protein AMJ65_06250 [Phycisphaerae bacterium SG8_4]|nr:MAG: hypothetical protein AMJ65_06250 [Phycisphaerae bacterium SG8_4]